MDVLSLAGFLGLVCTKLVDGIKHAVRVKIHPSLSIVLSVVIGIGFAAMLGLNIFNEFEGVKVSTAGGIFLSGLIIGGLGSGFYEVLDVVSTKASQIKEKNGVRRRQEQEKGA